MKDSVACDNSRNPPSKGRFYTMHNTARHKTIKNGMSIGHGFEENGGMNEETKTLDNDAFYEKMNWNWPRI